MTDAGSAQVKRRLGWRPEQGSVGKEWSPGHRWGGKFLMWTAGGAPDPEAGAKESSLRLRELIAQTRFNLSLAGFGAQEIPERG